MKLAVALASNFMNVVQSNNLTDPYTIRDLCNTMTNVSIGEAVKRYAAVNIARTKGRGLNVNYSFYVDLMKQTGWTSPIVVAQGILRITLLYRCRCLYI